MIKAGDYTIWFTFGRYDIIIIDHVLRQRATAVRSDGVDVTVRLCDCHGSFQKRAAAEKAVRVIRKIHSIYAKSLKRHEHALAETRKMRNKHIYDFLKGLGNG